MATFIAILIIVITCVTWIDLRQSGKIELQLIEEVFKKQPLFKGMNDPKTVKNWRI